MLLTIQKSNLCWIFNLLLGSGSLAIGWKFFLIKIYLFEFAFSETLWIDKLHNYVEGICLIGNGSYYNANISVIIATVANRIKYRKRKVNLTYSNYHWLNWVEWIKTTWEKMLQPQKGTISRVQNLFFCISWQPSKFLLLKLKTV